MNRNECSVSTGGKMIKYSVTFKDYKIDKIEPYEILLKQYSSLREYVEHELGENSWNYVSKIYAMHETIANIFKVHEVINWETLEESTDYVFTNEYGILIK